MSLNYIEKAKTGGILENEILKFMIEIKDLKANLTIGNQTFENVPDKLNPGWSGLILSRFNNYIEDIPSPVSGLFDIVV